MKTLFSIVCALALFACQSSPSVIDSEFSGMLEFRGEANTKEVGAQEFLFEGTSVLLSKARYFEVQVWSSVDYMEQPAIGFTVSEHQREEFGDYTESLKGQKLAIILGEQILTLPTVNGRLGNGGIINGGGGGFTEAEVNELIASIRAGTE